MMRVGLFWLEGGRGRRRRGLQRLTHGVSVTIGVMAGSLIGLLAVQTGDPPEVSSGNGEGGDEGGEEGSEGSVGDEVVLADVLASIVHADEVVLGTLLVHVDIQTGSIDDEEDGAGNESTKETQKKRPASCDLRVRPARSPTMPTAMRMIPLMRKAHREFTVPCLTKVKTMRQIPNICNNKLETRWMEENVLW